MHQAHREIAFIEGRLAEEVAAARLADPRAGMHRQLAADYAAALDAYRHYAEQLRQARAGASEPR